MEPASRMSLPHVPILRRGQAYESLDRKTVVDHRTGEPVAQIDQANAGLIRRDAKKSAHLLEPRVEDLVAMCVKAADIFLHETLPLGPTSQSPEQYIEVLSATSGLPHALVRRNMAKIHEVLEQMPAILRGLTRGLDFAAIDCGLGQQAGSAVSFFPLTPALGVVLPSNSPGVNSIWMPAVPLKVPVLIKPGSEEPWTPYRIIQALIAAGCPRQLFGFYPTDHEGADAILRSCERGLIFGDTASTSRYAGNPSIQIHGPGYSKIIVGEDQVERWKDHIDLMVESVCANGGRSCINVSTIVTPRHGREIAEALARRVEQIRPRAATDDAAVLAAFANPKMAEFIDAAIEQDLQIPGAAACTRGPRRVEEDGGNYLLPTVLHCESFDHPLANREFLCPYVAVVDCPEDEVLDRIGPSLAVTALTGDRSFVSRLLSCPHIDRLNLGAIPTTRLSWDQPHEGNLFEFLYRRRAIQKDGL